ncbi:MAG: alpha-L-fucosidase [Cytophagales bacterium]|nr:alpha-L-fucosidase [Cytophagales bacterium]
MIRLLLFFMIVIDGGKLYAQEIPHRTDWFKEAGFGLFFHYLNGLQNNKDKVNSQGKQTSWNECVNEFNTDTFASQVNETGARYIIFTMMQQQKYLCAPNETYNRFTGYKPGEACSKRDLVEDLFQSLKKYDIKLILYWTGDGPFKDKKAAEGLEYTTQTPEEFVENWAEVAAEYGLRYKEKVAGWWVDGCYSFSGYYDNKWTILARGLRKGFQDRIIALNNPQGGRAHSSTANDDYTTGEQNDFIEVPVCRWRDGAQFHILSWLGENWAKPGLKYEKSYLLNYVADVIGHEGVVSIDVALNRDGTLCEEQFRFLQGFKKDVDKIIENKY